MFAAFSFSVFIWARPSLSQHIFFKIYVIRVRLSEIVPTRRKLGAILLHPSRCSGYKLVLNRDIRRLLLHKSSTLSLQKQKNQLMKNLFFASILLMLISSCRIFNTLHSTTTIKPQESFVLGDNKHGKFSVKIRNLSANTIQVHRAPISGGKHSFIDIKPNEQVKVKVEPNTAFVINNASNDTAFVSLVVKGDVGLSMGYK